MMASFSPFTRRVVAIGILVLLLFGLVQLLLVPIYGATAGSLSGLEDARFQRSRLEAVAARPPLPRSEPVPASFYLSAADRQGATDRLIAAIGESAARYEVQLDAVAPMPADPGRPRAVFLSVGARGAHDAILAWVNELEAGAPAIYFADWSLGQEGEGGAAPVPLNLPEGTPSPPQPLPGAAGPVRLAFNATAVAVWEQKK